MAADEECFLVFLSINRPSVAGERLRQQRLLRRENPCAALWQKVYVEMIN
jgi:hypothetical protein